MPVKKVHFEEYKVGDLVGNRWTKRPHTENMAIVIKKVKELRFSLNGYHLRYYLYWLCDMSRMDSMIAGDMIKYVWEEE